jgi:hypothetical protein
MGVDGREQLGRKHARREWLVADDYFAQSVGQRRNGQDRYEAKEKCAAFHVQPIAKNGNSTATN